MDFAWVTASLSIRTLPAARAIFAATGKSMKKLHIVIIHLVFWITFVIVPYFFMFNFGEFRFTPENQYFMINHLFNAVVFYLAYFFIIPWALKRKSLARIISFMLVFVLIISFLRFMVNPWIKDMLGAFQRFGGPGLGRLFFDGIMARDYPLMMAAIMVASTLVLLGVLLADIAYAWADPRISYA